jgi:hypothetical protein
MTDDLTPPDDLLVRRAADGAAGASGPCLGDDDLLAWTERRLPEARAEVVEAHLAACADCRALTDTLGADLAALGASAGGGGRLLLSWLPLAAAAAILVGVAAYLLVEHGSAPGAPDVDQRLVATAADLAKSDPALFGGFRPLTAEERRAGALAAERGDGRVLAPAGTSDETRPQFRWAFAGFVDAVTVTVLAADGRTLLKREAAAGTSALDWPSDVPALAAGATYVVKLFARSVDASVGAARTFRVASAEEARRHADAVARIRARAPAHLADLLVAHLALRAERLLEAQRAAEAAVKAGGGNVAQETLAHVLRRLGWVEPR